MKKAGNVITYYWKEDKSPDRFRDKIIFNLAKRKKIYVHDGWTIEQDMPDGSKRVCGAFYTVTGPKMLVDFLSWLTNFTIGKTHKVDVSTDEKGTITTCKDI